MINNCPYKPEDRLCRLQADYDILQYAYLELEEAHLQLVDENRYLLNRIDILMDKLREEGIVITDIYY